MSVASARLPTPLWMVDGSRLRDTLDQLRSALTAPPVIAPLSGAGLAFDIARLADTVRRVADGAAGVDLHARRAVTGVTSPVGLAEETRRLTAMVEDLHGAWIARVRTKLGVEKARIAARLLDHDAPDLLNIFRKSDDENSHSDVLRWLLDPRQAPSVAEPALAALVSRFDDAQGWTKAVRRAVAADGVVVRREFVIGRASLDGDDLNRVDIIVWGPDFLIAIENKVWSLEHGEQTRAYWRWMCSLPYRRAGVFLTPAGDHAASPEFASLSYLDLLACLLEGPVRGHVSGKEEIVLAGYVKSLATRILSAELRRSNLGGNR